MKKLILTMLLVNLIVYGQKKDDFLSNFEAKAYGVVNYYNFDWDSDKSKRNEFDTERLNFYLKYNFSDKIQLKTEIEFEHGGTGVTMELDKFEEFGEFETEVEAGGEVKLEQINILFNYKPWLNLRVGRVKLYMGNASKLDLPTEYFTGYRSAMENALLPMGWYENGIELLGDFGKNNRWSYKAFFVNGLSSEAFSSANWIKRGHQQRFETILAENFAISARLDYNLKNDGFIGVSAYRGNTNGNRQKNDLKNTDGNLSIIDAHANLDLKDFKLRVMFLYGNLQNADKISSANRNLPNALDVKRTPVAKNAMGYYVEAAYNIMPLLIKKPSGTQKLFVFGRYDFYDSMYKTTGDITDNPRWERSVFTTGLNYHITKDITFKTHYAVNSLGADTLDGYNNVIGNKERTFLLGMGFKID